MVVATLTGTAALAIKRIIWDPFFVKQEPSNELTYKDLRLEIKALQTFGYNEEAKSLKKFIGDCEADCVPPSQCKDLYERAKQLKRSDQMYKANQFGH